MRYITKFKNNVTTLQTSGLARLKRDCVQGQGQKSKVLAYNMIR